MSAERLEKLQRLRDGRRATQDVLERVVVFAEELELDPLQMIAEGVYMLLAGEGSLHPGDGSVLAGALRVMASLSVRLHGTDLPLAQRDRLDAAVHGAVNALRALDESEAS